MPIDWVGDAVSWVGNALGDVGTGISNAASSVAGGIGDAASAVGTGIEDAVQGVGTALGIGGAAGAAGAEGSAGAIGAAGEPSVIAPAAAGVAPGAGSIAAPAGAMPGADVIDFTEAGGQGGALKGAAPAINGWETPSGTPGSEWNAPGASGNSVAAAFKDPSISNVGTAIGNNSNWLLPAGALGASMMLGNAQPKGSAQVSQAAAQLGQAGQELQSYITNGTLPPGVQASITSAAELAKAAVRSQYAKMGMSGSSAEAADLQHVETTATTQGTQIALQLLQQGVSDTSISAQLYGELMKNAMSSDQSLVQALGALAGSAARPTINLTTTG